MSDPWARTRTVYDTVAENYAELVRTTGSEAVLDLAMLEDFAGRVPGRARVLDAGCGPGRLTRYLSDRGVDAFGTDLSPAMVRVARRLHPDLDFAVGSIDALDVESHSLSGVLAWYSIIHTPPAHLPIVLSELMRVLEPGGWLVTGHQSGWGDRRVPNAYGHDIDVTAHLYSAEHVAGAIDSTITITSCRRANSAKGEQAPADCRGRTVKGPPPAGPRCDDSGQPATAATTEPVRPSWSASRDSCRTGSPPLRWRHARRR